MNMAVSGKICSGKSLVRNRIKQHGFQSVSLAAPLKQLADIAIDGEPHEALFLIEDITEDFYYAAQMYAGWYKLAFDWEAELRSGHKPRHFLQELGTMMRSFPNYQNILVDHLLRTCLGDDYVCDDLRYQNEAKAFRKHNWVLVRCECPEEIRRERCIKLYGKFGSEQEHPTEIDLDNWEDWDFVVDTSVTKEQQAKVVDKIMQSLYPQ